MNQTKEPALTVLIVDDEEHILELLRSFLEQKGMRVFVAESAEQAITLPDLEQVQVGILDIRLPGTSGRDLQQELNVRFPDMAKILMSGQADLDDIIAAFSDQAFAFIQKPFTSLKGIAVLVERAAQNKRLEVQNRDYVIRLAESKAALTAKHSKGDGGKQRLHQILSHLYDVSPRLCRIESEDKLLDFVCQSLVDAGAFGRAVILVCDDKFRVRHVGAWQSEGTIEPLKDTLRALCGQPLRPFEFDRLEKAVGDAIHTRSRWSSSAGKADSEDGWKAGDQLLVPLYSMDGAVFGYLSVEAPPDNANPDVNVVHMLEVLLAHGAYTLESRAARSELLKRVADAEARSQEQTAEVRLAEDRFNRLVSVAADIVFITDEHDRLTLLNESFTRILGYVRENYIGHTLRHLIEDVCTDNPLNRRAVQELVSPCDHSSVLHVEVLTRGGDKRTLEINRTIIRQGGEVKGTQGLVRDVTEQRALMQQLITSERLATTGRIAAGVAHEINNPLQAILSQIKAIEQKVAAREDPTENLELTRESIEQLRFVVNSMLDLNRASAAPRLPVNLNILVQQVLALVQQQVTELNIQVRSNLAVDLPPVSGSPQEFQQVILNLFLNAIAAMPDGGELRISTVASEDRIQLCVEDTGVGIASEILPRIFESFFTLRGSGAGTGLGLFISKNIVEMNQGSITAESEESHGSRFTVTLPVAR